MTIKTDVNLKGAFTGEEARKEVRAPEIPESIKRHAPVPVLKPDGSWRARANEVDCRVREEKAAQKAKNEWAARSASLKPDGARATFSKSARR
jgi:hypothetical protein